MRSSSFWKGLILGAAVASLAFWAAGLYHQAEEGAREVTCTSGLLEARPLFEWYKEKHAGKYPPRLDDLDLSNASADALRCPKAQKLGVHAYLYIPPSAGAPEDTPILICWRHARLLILTKGGELQRWPR